MPAVNCASQPPRAELQLRSTPAPARQPRRPPLTATSRRPAHAAAQTPAPHRDTSHHSPAPRRPSATPATPATPSTPSAAGPPPQHQLTASRSARHHTDPTTRRWPLPTPNPDTRPSSTRQPPQAPQPPNSGPARDPPWSTSPDAAPPTAPLSPRPHPLAHPRTLTRPHFTLGPVPRGRILRREWRSKADAQARSGSERAGGRRRICGGGCRCAAEVRRECRSWLSYAA